MSGREVIAVPTYLIHFRDNELALAVGAALEGRLAADGRDAIALVPAGDGLGLTRAADGGRGAGRGSYRAAPQVVALYEDGLLEQLEALGVTAYVGIGPEHEPSVARWGDGGALLLPVATARELVDAVADHTPWAAHAAGMTPLAGLGGGLTGPATPGLSRTLAVAGIAGPLLLAGLPGVASAATAPASHHPAAPAGARAVVTAVDTSLFKAKGAPPVPVSTRAFLNQIERSLRLYLQELRQTSTGNTTGIQALENQITRLVNAMANAQPRTNTQPAPQQQGGGSAGGGGQAPSNAGSQNGSGGQGQQSAGGQGQGQQGQGQQGQGQDQQGQAPQNQDVNQGQQDQNQQNGQDQNQQDPNGSQGSSTSQGPSTSQGSMSGQGNSGQGTSGQGNSGQGTSGSGLGTTASGSGGNSGLGSSSSGGGSYSGGGSSGGNSGGGSSGGNSGGGSSGGGSA